MNRSGLADRLSVELDDYLNGIPDKDKLDSREYNELLEIGKGLIDMDFSKNSNKEAVYYRTLNRIEAVENSLSNKSQNWLGRGLVIAASFLLICSISFTLIEPSFAFNLMEKVIATINLGNIKVVQFEAPKEFPPIPEALKGKIFDQEGNPLVEIPVGYSGRVYTSEGKEIVGFSDGEIITIDMANANREENILVIKNPSALSEYTCFEVLLPSYLPSGYQFDRAEFYKDENGIVQDSKYINLYFTNYESEAYIFLQQRFSDEETAYELSTDGKVQLIKINGVDAVLSNNRGIDWEMNDTLYGLNGRGLISKAELIKIAESIK
ncbi:DUF4367 domain-containing protein [Alkaliphilus transvaalensis]|uniref:DUF4367 domain-containing protein n=1 Tax=Alkaliphilus transvaalensis TaxID=114628 RepID=UPI000479105D|nr:DUF4367 domain-containing protein [Alkaliphilus transvaalensis]